MKELAKVRETVSKASSVSSSENETVSVGIKLIELLQGQNAKS